MSTLRPLIFVLSSAVLLLASCQTSRVAFQARPFGHVAAAPADTATTVVLLHDSQGPQATRVALPTAEAAAWRQR
jgi:ABC-type arginine transport system permease subunit